MRRFNALSIFMFREFQLRRHRIRDDEEDARFWLTERASHAIHRGERGFPA